MNSNRCSTSVCASALLAAASLTFSPAVWSLGLGDAQVESYLNQPLKARIDLITQVSDDLASVTARLASAADYELIGASRESVSVPIRFTVEDIDGDAYILATSSLPVGEPVVRLIVEVNWSSGRMLREYTLFLDPPAVPEPAPAPRIDLRQETARAPAASEAAPQPEAAAPAAAGEYGPVRAGQTLWGIASDWSRGSGLDINQAMLAIQRENPHAFLNENINLLKRGAILRMPRVADVQGMPTAAAQQEVAAQHAAFRAFAAPATVASAATPLLAADSAAVKVGAQEPASTGPSPEATAPSAADESVAAEEDSGAEAIPGASGESEDAAAEAARQQDLLELVPPSADSELDNAQGIEEGEVDVEADVDVLREELARKEEELITQQQQTAYLEERLQELESQLESAGEGRVADADLANMEERLREQRQAEPPAQPEPGKPWYARAAVWLVALLVFAAALIGWLVSRRGRIAEASGMAQVPLRDIKSEAEDVLRTLGDDREPAPGIKKADAGAAVDSDEGPAGEAGEPLVKGAVTPERFLTQEEDAELLDEDSSDPEIQLDLARAYISMGDKEAARVILEEVVNNGSDEQQVEARKMLDLLT